MNNLGLLPPEVLSLIVDHIDATRDLYHCARINSSFYTVANPKLWREPFNNYRQKYGRPSVSSSLLKTLRLDLTHPLHPTTPLGHHIHKLEFDRDLTKDIYNVLALCPVLQDITLKSQMITDVGIKRICGLCPRLKILKLESLTNITDTSMITLALRCHHLQELELCMNIKLTINSLNTLKNMPLIRLVFINHHWGPRNANESLPLDSFSRLAQLKASSNIATYFLRHSLPTDNNSVLGELEIVNFLDSSRYVLIQFLNTHPRLHTLGLDCPIIHAEIFASMVNLRTLKLRQVYFGHHSALLPRLENLYLYNCVDESHFLFNADLPNLQVLSIMSNHSVDAFILLQVVIKCARLTCLDLSNCSSPIPRQFLGVGLKPRILLLNDLERIRNSFMPCH